MRLSALEAGNVVELDQSLFVLADAASSESLTLVSQETGIGSDRSIADLESLWCEGRLTLHPGHIQGQNAVEAAPVAMLSEKERARVVFRLSVLRAIDALPAGRRLVQVDGRHPVTGRTVTKPVAWHEAARLCHAAGLKPVAISTIYEWKKLLARHQDPSALRGAFEKIGKASPLAPEAREALHELVDTTAQRALAAVRAGKRDRIKPKRLQQELARTLPPGTAAPSTKTIAAEVAKLPAYTRDAIELGPRHARSNYRMSRGVERPQVCLDRVEYDETKLDLVIVDEDFGYVLGIPWLSWYVDSTSTGPLGVYLGFEPMSDVSTMAALRHACLPKAYVKYEYPTINGELLAGVPRGIVFDNGMTQHGDTIAQTALDLQFDYAFAPPYTPWFKGSVEKLHHLLNQLLLDELPGFVISGAARPAEYDPKKNACIGLRHFMYILHHWIADIYLQTPTGPFSLRPIDRWKTGTARFPPRLLSNVRDLDLTFGIFRPGNLDHRGIRFESLYYLSPEMEDYRRRHGHSFPVDVRVNPTDIGHLYWRGPDQLWRKATARHWAYARGRSVFQHRLVLRNARERSGGEDEVHLLAAHAEMQRLGREALAMALPLRNRAQIARGLGYGTEHLFATHDQKGGMGHATGPFGGMLLNPFAAAPAVPDEALGKPKPATGTKQPRKRFEARRL